jgi:hypothetical protein
MAKGVNLEPLCENGSRLSEHALYSRTRSAPAEGQPKLSERNG